ncbi:MAG TPA: Calx-beta domain-containing protein, partial [Pyrinomonadaceae bacterium]
GSEPGRLALGDDGKTLYVYLEGSKNLRRFDLQTQTPGIQFSVGSQTPADIEVMPGSPQSVAVSPGVNFSSGPTVYDDGVARPKSGTSGNGFSFYAVLPIEFGATPSVLYGYDSYSSGFELVKFNVDATGVTTAAVTYNLLSGYSNDIKFAGGLLYSSSGRVVDPEAKRLVGTFSQAGGVFAVDATLGRIFYLTGDSFSGSKVLKSYDMNTFLPLGSVTIPNLTGNPTRMVRWGANGLAIRTANSNFGSNNNDGGVYIIQSALVSNSQPVPTGVALSSNALNTTEWNGTMTVNVTRTGEVSAPTTVSYNTTDGTATAGSDYTAASGTLTFAAGELTKSFNITIRQDNVYEGTENFTVTLSAPTGGALLAGPSSALVTLNDDESKPSLSITDVRVNEGNAGQTEAQVLVSLSNASVETVTVNYATGDGTASSASDFVANSGTLTFAPLTTAQLVKVKINGDYTVEPDETFIVSLTGAVNTSYVSRSQATGTIVNDDGPGRFQFAGPSSGQPEDAGAVTVTVNRANGQSGAASVNNATTGGTATAGTDYTAVSGTLNFAEGETSKTFTVPVTADTTNEPSETIVVTLSSPTGGALLGVPTSTTLVVVNDDQPTYQFASTFYEAGEPDGQVVLTVTRGGDPNMDVSVSYTTADGTATEMSDYNLTLGTLHFAPGETQKTLTVLLTDDALGEGDETFLVTLFGHTSGVLGTPSTATVTLHSNEAATGPNPVGDGFDAQFFVRQHYHDFLNREPDAAGLAFWANEFTQCGSDAACRDVKRVNVSAAFFLSIEFQQTGFLVYRLHQAAYNTQETLNWRTFLADTQEVGRDVQVGVGNWEAKLEANKKAFVDRFAATPAFALAYQGMSNAQYVDALNSHTLDPLAPGLGGALTQAERDQLVADLSQSKKTRADVLRAVAENAEFSRRQSNKAFVLMQYFGYLRRNPNSGPDADFSGYNFWLGKLNEFQGNFIQAEMVKAFLDSIEYKRRFGQ